MKKILLSSILLLQSFLLAAPNLLTNPGFESGLTGWVLDDSHSTSATGTLALTTVDPNTGTNAAQASISQVSGENWHVQLNVPYNWSATAGNIYKLTFFAKGSSSIHIAAQGGSPDFAYLGGTDASLNDTWKEVTFSYEAPADGSGALRFNIYLGSAIGDYYFDDFTIEEQVSSASGSLQLPQESFYTTGTYRNPFLELGYSQSEIDQKVDNVFQQLFYGDSASEKLYFEVETDMAFIKTIDTDDIRSEGMSYGMMIALQLDKKVEFDKLWKFAKTYMQHQDGNQKGYFAWQLATTAPYTAIDENPAPDGEEYFALALFFAAKRWGNEAGIFNYEAEANNILYEMIHKTTVNPLINDQYKQIIFSPFTNPQYTDPSYHLPAFYELFALYADQDNSLWLEIADSSRAFFKKACNSQTGLTSDYATFDGQPQSTTFNANSHRFAYDSHRIGMNIAMDYNWFKKDEWQVSQSNRYLDFFSSQGASYGSVFEVDGTVVEAGSAASLVAMNGVAAMASDNADANNYVKAVWNMGVPSGQWRYYNGLLYMFSILNLSGNYKMYGVTHPGATSISDTFNKTVNEFSFYLDGKSLSLNSYKQQQVEIFNLNGKLVSSHNISNGSTFNFQFSQAGVYFIRSQNQVEKIIVK